MEKRPKRPSVFHNGAMIALVILGGVIAVPAIVHLIARLFPP